MSSESREGPADQDLLIRWQDGDQRAGQVLFHRYYDRIECFFLTKVTVGVEDLVQETFMGCLKGHKGVRDPSRFSQYLFRIAYNVLNSHLRSRYKRGVAWHGDDVSVEDIAPGPITILTEQEEQRLLLMALRRIPWRLQVILELHYWEHKTMTDIAEIVGLKVGTVKSRMSRARQLLAEAVESLDESPELLRSTASNLDDWVASCRKLLAHLQKTAQGS